MAVAPEVLCSVVPHAGLEVSWSEREQFDLNILKVGCLVLGFFPPWCCSGSGALPFTGACMKYAILPLINSCRPGAIAEEDFLQLETCVCSVGACSLELCSHWLCLWHGNFGGWGVLMVAVPVVGGWVKNRGVCLSGWGGGWVVVCSGIQLSKILLCYIALQYIVA